MPAIFNAFIFDLNGTIIDDMDYHIKAWYKIFNRLGAPLTYEETREQCYGKNEEVLERVLPGKFSGEEKTEIGISKEKQYRKEFRPHLKLIDGLDKFLCKTKETGIKMGIGSAAIMDNVDFVLDGLHIRHYFDAIVSADNVQLSKPHPETFLKCAAELNVNPSMCLVFEDSAKGIESAAQAGMKTVVLTTMHKKEEFKDYDNHIVSYIKDYRKISTDLFSKAYQL